MSKNAIYILIIFLCVVCFAGFVEAGIANKDKSVKQLPLPRFVTLSADEVNVRVGPGIRYPIKLVLKKERLPVEIIKEFDVWREVRSIDGDAGWVHKSLLSGKRSVIIKDYIQTIYKKPNKKSKPVVKLEPGVIARLDHCKNEWCYLNVASYKGWIKRENIWGVYSDEAVEK